MNRKVLFATLAIAFLLIGLGLYRIWTTTSPVDRGNCGVTLPNWDQNLPSFTYETDTRLDDLLGPVHTMVLSERRNSKIVTDTEANYNADGTYSQFRYVDASQTTSNYFDYSYSRGRLVSSVLHGIGGDGSLTTIKYAYDDQGRLAERDAYSQDYGASLDEPTKVHYLFDADGNEVVGGLDTEERYQYSKLGTDLISVAHLSNPSTEQTIQLQEDGSTVNTIHVNDPSTRSTTIYHYGRFGQVTKMVFRNFWIDQTCYHCGDLTERYTRILITNHPPGKPRTYGTHTFSYVFDRYGNWTQQTDNYQLTSASGKVTTKTTTLYRKIQYY